MSDPTGHSNEAKVRLRQAVADGYSMVKGLSFAVSLAQATPEQMMQERIAELIGPSTNPRRPARLDQVKKIRATLQDAIIQIRNTPPDQLSFNEAEDGVSSAITDETTGESEGSE
jgi:hypothetical protein